MAHNARVHVQRDNDTWGGRARYSHILLVCMRAQPVSWLYLLDAEDVSHAEEA